MHIRIDKPCLTRFVAAMLQGGPRQSHALLHKICSYFEFALRLIKLMNVITCTIVLSATIMLKSLYFRTLDLYIKITSIFSLLALFFKVQFIYYEYH
jgi:hypothetical protein